MYMGIGLISYKLKKWMKAICPVKSGDMRDYITSVWIDENTMAVRISPGIPYVVYTNEKWVSPRWKGKKNPNEKWIDQGVAQFVDYLAADLGGEVKFNQEDAIRRWNNQNYWDSPEGQKKLKEYNML